MCGAEYRRNREVTREPDPEFRIGRC
uniref:Uncharacterized protein n=1 Tax=Arundo donax TaxID=35708 RepID=A0A0A8Z4T6_ARUDO